jgi:hypothetical protein
MEGGLADSRLDRLFAFSCQLRLGPQKILRALAPASSLKQRLRAIPPPSGCLPRTIERLLGAA